MLDRLQALADRYDKLSELFCDPDVVQRSETPERTFEGAIGPAGRIRAYTEYKQVSEQLERSKVMQNEKLDDEMREMVKMEIDELSARTAELEEQIHLLAAAEGSER